MTATIGNQRLQALTKDIAEAGNTYQLSRHMSAGKLRAAIVKAEAKLEDLYLQLEQTEARDHVPAIGTTARRQWVIDGVVDALACHRAPSHIAAEYGYRDVHSLMKALNRWGQKGLAKQLRTRPEAAA